MKPLAELLPQAAPMILLSGYEEQTDESRVIAFVDVTESSPFFDAVDGGVPAETTLEYMAQTMALLVGLTRQRKGLPPQIGFVLGSRKMVVSIPAYVPGHRYTITADCIYNDDEFGSFDCHIVDDQGAEVASGVLTAYQPDREMTSELFEKYE